MRVTAICIRNFKRRKLRTVLCISEIAIAVAFLVGVSALTSRMTAIIKEMNTLFEDEIIVVSRDVIVIQGFPIGGSIPERIIDELKRIEGVEEAIPMLFNLDLKVGGTSALFPANVSIGLPLEKLSILFPESLLIIEGQLPLDKYEEILIGRSIADQYSLSVGSIVNFKGMNLLVSGIIRGPSIIMSRSIIMSLELAQKIHKYEGQISMAVVRLKPNIAANVVANKIEGEFNYVMALTENERNDVANSIFNEISIWHHITEIFTMVVSGILVATVEIMNLSESRRDFATLIAIGSSKMSLIKIVAAETFLIGFLGGSLGILFGGLSAVILASLHTNIPIIFFIWGFFDIITPHLIGTVLALNIFICIASGILPAIFALKINVSATLRSEY
ncbi:MAG: FtsX-like permease family protein [Candidatus Bathyarchaeia archaeon]